jgi:hypothetical protein
VIHEKTGVGKAGNAVIDIGEEIQAVCDKLDLVPAEVARMTVTPNSAIVYFLDGSYQTFAVKA